MNENQTEAFRALWDALSDILEDEMAGCLPEELRQAGVGATDKAREAFPEEA